MYSNGESFGMGEREKWMSKTWRRIKRNREKSTKDKKYFVDCICPKCSVQHKIYMMWTGRGVPRKYCCTCKPLISGYDDATYEASVSMAGHSKRKGRHYEGD